jgi:DNA repair ATPase RecN
MKVMCNEAGIEALHTFGDGIVQAAEDIEQSANNLQGICDAHRDNLGPHVDEIEELIQEIIEITKKYKEPIEGLKYKMYQTADAFQAVIDKHLK